MGSAFQTIFTPANFSFMMAGLGSTVLIALCTTALSLAFGTLLALARHFCRGRLGWLARLSGAYIEFFRCTPNILWILWIRFTVKGNPVVLGILACTLFTSAVMAEIIRGGLNGIPKGQFESAASQGFGFFQTLFYIILPQALKSLIPALLSQVITVVKDTSFLKAVDIAELMRNSNVVLGTLKSPAEIIMLYAFIALCYFIICFSLSWAARSFQKRQAGPAGA